MDMDLQQAIYDAMQDGLYAFDKKGRILNINAAMERMLGFSKEEVIGEVGHNLFHLHSFEEQTPICECPIYKAFLDSKEYQGEEVFCKKDGSPLHVEVSCSVIYQEGQKYGYVVLFKDISKRKKIEKEMLTLAKVVKEMHDIIVIKDLDLRVITANEAFAKASGRKSVDEVIGKTDAQIFGVDPMSEPVRSYMEDDLEAQRLKPGEYILKNEPLICLEGDTKYLRTRKFPIYDNENRVIATAKISVDITQQKNYEMHLEKTVEEEVQRRSENELFYNKIFEMANFGICLTNEEGRFVAVNPRYCEIYGYEEKELIGEHFTKLMTSVKKEAMSRLHEDFLKQRKKELNEEWDALHKSGKPLRILSSASILENIVGGPYKITTISDITESYEARKVQQEQQAMLIQQNKLATMGEMLGSIAHQWRQPLNVMSITALDLKLKTQMGSINDGLLKKGLEDIEHVTQKMNKTINDFMEFFKPTKYTEVFYVGEAFEHAYRIMAPQIKDNDIHVNITLDEKIRIRGVKGELEQVFLNLLGNAKDALSASKVQKKEIKIYALQEKNSLVLCCEDNAGGIEESIIERVFEPYFTTKGSQKGTGIGLYMSSMIISKTFKGNLEAKNIYDENGVREGVVMRIVLPDILEPKVL